MRQRQPAGRFRSTIIPNRQCRAASAFQIPVTLTFAQQLSSASVPAALATHTLPSATMTRTITREHADLALARFWADQGKDRHLLLVPGQTAFVHPELEGVDCQAWYWRTAEGWTKHMNAYHRGHGCLLSQHKVGVHAKGDGCCPCWQVVGMSLACR